MSVYIMALFAFGIVGYMLVKRMDIKITLFAVGLVLMFIAIATGKEIAMSGFKPTGLTLLDPFYAVITQFKSTLTSAGFIILILGGYTSYMSAIGANETTVGVLAKSLGRVKSVYFLVPMVFLLGNVLSLVIPSASNLAIILLATLYPILRSAGMTTLTAAAVIATTATCMPTPLGGDNVAIVAELSKLPLYENLTVSDYVFRYHALISIPTLLLMALTHYFWQKFMDRKLGAAEREQKHIEGKDILAGKSGLFKVVYAILPLFPILILLGVYGIQIATDAKIPISVELATLASFMVAIACELLRYRGKGAVLAGTQKFFDGMGNAISIVVLLVAASVFVAGLQSNGLISTLQNVMTGLNGSGLGFVLPLILVVITAVIVFLSGSGVALFYAMVPLMAPLAAAASIDAFAVTIPMGIAGNLLRAVSPVSAVVMIVAGTTKQNPIDIIKRTSAPMIVGTVFMFILSMVIFL